MSTPDEVRTRAEQGNETPTLSRSVGGSWVSDELLAQLVHSLADAVVIADPDGAIVFWNEAAVRLFGWSSGEAIGQSLDLIIPERLRARHWAGYHHVMGTGRTSYAERLLEVPALHRDGRRLSIAFTVTLLLHPGETRPHAIAAVLRDDTERWQERRDLQAEIVRLHGFRDPAATLGAHPPARLHNGSAATSR